MAYSHEIINYPDNLPMTLFIHTIGSVQKHWHKSIELLLVLEGSVTVVIGTTQYQLEAEDVFLVNSNTIHDLHSENATLVAIQIKLDLLRNVPAEFKTTHYTCDSSHMPEPKRYEPIKNIVSRLLKINLAGGKYISLMNESLCYNLIYELYATFADGTLGNQDDTSGQLNRLNEILAIINSEYTEKLSLEYIAEKVYVTPPYLSKFFKNSMGISLSEYIKSTRLGYATNDLIYCDYPIDTISRNNGFPNTHAFVKAFKEKYEMLPSVWRNQKARADVAILPLDEDRSINYYETDSATMHKSLHRFIQAHAGASDHISSVVDISESSYKIYSAHSDGFEGLGKKFIGVSHVKELLFDTVKRQLAETHKLMHFDYIKMHGILDDCLFVYSETAEGKPVYNFTLIDQVFDFLLSIELKPMVQLSFMPAALAKNTDRKMFNGHIIISEPKDMKKWNKLIRNLVLHLIDRYSLQVVNSWIFCVWNEPSTANELFGFKNAEVFYHLYKESYTTIKEVSSSLNFGGPSAFATYGKKDSWLFHFLEFADQNHCRPDFITLHYYDIDLSDAFFLNRKSINELWLSPEPNSFYQHLRTLKNQLAENNYGDIPLYISEWNSTTSHKDLLSDTCFKSSYIVKNMIEASTQADGICYWLLTDLHEENYLPSSTFHGGLGLYTFNDIKKPAFYALDFVNRIGNEVLFRDQGILATKKNDDIIILLYHYHHYSSTYARDIGINTSYTDRYSVFPSKSKKDICLEFPDLDGEYTITSEYVNTEHGSAFDRFLAMGAVEPLTEKDVAYLKNISIPCVQKHRVSSPDIQLKFTLRPFEIRLITMHKMLK
jgi:xylan 1,4-beta-xylosidase